MGCGGDTQEKVVAPQEAPQKPGAEKLLRGPSFVHEGNSMEKTEAEKPFSISEKGTVEILSVHFVVKYSGKNKCLEITVPPSLSILSTLSWASFRNMEYLHFNR